MASAFFTFHLFEQWLPCDCGKTSLTSESFWGPISIHYRKSGNWGKYAKMFRCEERDRRAIRGGFRCAPDGPEKRPCCVPGATYRPASGLVARSSGRAAHGVAPWCPCIALEVGYVGADRLQNFVHQFVRDLGHYPL